MDLVIHFADKIPDKMLKVMANSEQILKVKQTLGQVQCWDRPIVWLMKAVSLLEASHPLLSLL